ncbi:MAG: HAMP domain-containing protein [Alphaproteobacteria bacterium]|nr:HAMP domain-containing protein [Alphaproteobacteria bacterium]MBU1515666.1 HAMP domain-containing protein [Alphaproteobacteria bacterium]MBU2094925.1 HAMP domain-containing protein [Alphaproteobacteria bacterium]MBU2150957.1 HAMP domain-containing protein [Alphaproteobacteria bacterium]MBU2305934.1 HAMP domain-containing protein [Alphaproteobacteria bacterium]
MKLPARPRASIGLQLVALIVACLFATHLIVFAAIVLLPPPQPPLYRLTEIAGALQGGPLNARFGRPMLRTLADRPPQEPEGRRRGGIQRDALAVALGRPREDVHFAPRPPTTLEKILLPEGRRMLFEHRARGERPPGPPHEPPPPPDEAGGPPPPPMALHMRGPREMVLGDFTAAVRRADGRWTVVRSSPEPFPNDWQKRTLLLLAAGFAVVAPAGLLFARRITAPLKRFSEAAERLGRDPHAPQMTLSGPAEIGAAAEAFNGMQGRLKRYIDDRTAMVGAISHDLRTPLARIRFKMEGAERGLKDTVLSDVAQMEQMIQGVLTFIRNESTPRHRERLELLSLVECVVDDAAMVGGDVELFDSMPVTVDGDAVALQRLFVNLVDNAVKYGGQARIRVSQEDGQAVVEIEDAGQGLSPDDLERVFQPFYRADASRNLDAGGIGLGLPIARSTARAHGGDVELIAADRGLRARVTLPIA